ncbi:MAG: ABC transporter ATP-binding protein [Vicinamibacterales bacterium]|nr:ABC transporter ATP-binding protein [Vicinamibacterales bacterium]MDP6608101.1 ABC transporter ATP-binding protein [Vicinamibacterales bacterium]
MIRLEGVAKRFGEVEALAALDLEIRAGEWLGVFGRNGSGKTSLLRILVGLSQPSSGRILFDGEAPDADAWRRVHRALGFMPERVSFFEHLTGEKTLRYLARLKGVSQDEVGPLLSEVDLAGAAHRKLGGYSKGMLQRLNFAQALLGNPRLLVVDEPIEGLDAHGVREFFEILKRVEGRTVVMSSHRVGMMSRYMNRVCVLNAGRIAALGTESDLHRTLDLPVRITLQPSVASNGHLAAELERLAIGSVASRNGAVVVSVSQRDKIRFLACLQPLEGSIDSVRIEEPSLEEVLRETH